MYVIAVNFMLFMLGFFFLESFSTVVYVHFYCNLPSYKYLFELLSGSILYLVLEQAIYTFFAINL